MLYEVITLIGGLFWAAAVFTANYTFVGSNFPILSNRSPDGKLGGIGGEISRIICMHLGYTASIHQNLS